MSSRLLTKNDVAWHELFDKYRIIEEVEDKGYFNIRAGQINQFREARLMTKFDHRNNLPQLFKSNNLAILPISRGEYTISRFEAYHTFESNAPEIYSIRFPDYLQSIDYENITSEATAINTAYVTEMLADFVEDEELLPTVSGRMSSSQFKFNIKGFGEHPSVGITVSNSQVEIDGGYEGLKTLSLIEAKNSVSDDFLIRQLYYPYRLWNQKVIKDVKSIFLTYSNGVFSFYDYVFEDESNYNSLILRKQKNYSIEGEEIEYIDLEKLVSALPIVEELDGIPFPQADSFKRVISLCEILHENEELSRDDITYRYDFDSRQTNYYTDAARYLGLVDKRRENGSVQYFLTDSGKDVFRLSIKNRNLKFAGLILSHQAFRMTYDKCLEIYEMPRKEIIVEYMKQSNLYNVSAESTFFRRASTITGWVNWILDLIR